MNASKRPAGVTAVVCCHNSVPRLAPTLSHLAAQQVPEGIGFEVVLVDNGSTDGTPEVARQLWPSDSRFSLRVVQEPVLGQTKARRRGLTEAAYEFVSFVDDDNWVCSDWVRLVHEILTKNPRVGACGGSSEAVFEIQPPSWFATYQGNWAVGEQHEKAGDVTASPNVLWGAGLTIRRSAWDEMMDGGFRFALHGRSGKNLVSAEDHELCFGLILAGWRLWYEPRLRLKHYMPALRLEWAYLRRLLRAAGWSGAWLDPYREALGQPAGPAWFWSASRIAFLLMRNPLRLARCVLRPREGKPEVAAYELMVGRLWALARCHRAIDEVRSQLARRRRKN